MLSAIEEIAGRLANHEARIATLENLIKGHAKVPTVDSGGPQGSQNVDLANKIHDGDEDLAASRILLSKSMEAKLLLCFYVSYKYFGNRWLSTGDLEQITSELGSKLDKANVSNKLKAMRQYLESGAVRRKGQPTPYRLNRKGVVRFEAIRGITKA